MRKQVLMVFLPTIAMFLAVCVPKPPSLGKYPYLALGCIIVLGVLNLRLTRIHKREMWRLERELCARHDQALRKLSALVPSEAACDHLINQSIIERLGASDNEPHYAWLEPSVKVLLRHPLRSRAPEIRILMRATAPATCHLVEVLAAVRGAL
jgi:hypothetical protein